MSNFLPSGWGDGYFNAMNRVLQMLRDAHSRKNINRSDLERLANLAKNVHIGRLEVVESQSRNADPGHRAAANFWNDFVGRINHIANDKSSSADHLSL